MKMCKRKLSEFKISETFTAFFLIRKVEAKATGGGNKYLDILLGDSTGEIAARMWDCTPEDEIRYVSNILVKVKGSVVEWQGKKQIKIDKIRPVLEEDGVNIKEFIPVAPREPEEMYAELYEYTIKIGNKKIRELVQLIIAESGERLLTCPAAVMNHHALRSGLLYHTLTMLQAGERLLEVYSFLDKDLVFAGIILHDIAKTDEINANQLGLASEYTVEGQLLGHIVQGIKRIEKASRSIGLDVETSILLEHMILSHHYEPEFGSPKRPMIPEAELLHYLDILDARMFDMQKALSEVQNGEFTDKLWALNNRKIYKRESQE
ncbi:MAG: 3'-5' exoribonuclease YhaM [Candidatus Dichloromethanomonas elyunquensis]|nr:MAG: 3'-5' exoribonuclease YhaM [Candidatus Dichloromethanomonas elyunquensis]